MKKLEASYLSSVHKESSLQQISEVLDKLEKNSIEMVPWPVFSYKPEALFAIAYNDDGIFIKYFVSEKSIRAMYRRANEPVYKDSCVDFLFHLMGKMSIIISNLIVLAPACWVLVQENPAAHFCLKN